MKNKIIILSVAMFLCSASIASASHSWGDYHWARKANPFTIKLGSNLTGAWPAILSTASTDWSVSTVLDTTIVKGNRSRNCSPTLGRVEVCNAKYGTNGWLGIAQIWVSGSHITKGAVKLNDTYFSKPTYNTVAWKNLVACQEIGHTFGLDHQDEDFSNPNLNTCMDYTSNPTSNQHPNAHDYEQLGLIYTHLDTITTVAQSTVSSLQSANDTAVDNDMRDLGKSIRKSKNKRLEVFEKDFGKGQKKLTHVFWVEPQPERE